MATLTPHRQATEVAIARFVAHVDSKAPKDAAEAIERRLTKIMVSELLRAYADFEDLLTQRQQAQSYIENAITNGLLSLISSIAKSDADLSRKGICDILDNIEHRALSRIPDGADKDVFVNRFVIPKTGRA